LYKIEVVTFTPSISSSPTRDRGLRSSTGSRRRSAWMPGTTRWIPKRRLFSSVCRKPCRWWPRAAASRHYLRAGRPWGAIGALGVALVLPGGLVLLLYLIARSQTRARSTVGDFDVEWMRSRYRLRSERRPPAGIPAVISPSRQPHGTELAIT